MTSTTNSISLTSADRLLLVCALTNEADRTDEFAAELDARALKAGSLKERNALVVAAAELEEHAKDLRALLARVNESELASQAVAS
jgi:hypothetical protein